ncbi:response regulator [Arsenicitalea aurantiaca]|uniref:Response regulator n=1 Tax=Arsenicitalea aurantiaca TaxID=1783274 RepID=A0A433XAE2_9HYPH|nr:response regulator [Arsenicitalea aurantiaca]RUT31039.1 response regulator [Arsenicitalea aurantiaca]
MKTVAVMTASPALTAIATMMAAALPGVTARPFVEPLAFAAALRHERIDLIIADFDCPRMPADRLAHAIRVDTRVGRTIPIIALGKNLGRDARCFSSAVGIDEVILKPMSPLHLYDRIRARLVAPAPIGPANVIPLFSPLPN